VGNLGLLIPGIAIMEVHQVTTIGAVIDNKCLTQIEFLLITAKALRRCYSAKLAVLWSANDLCFLVKDSIDNIE